MAKTTKQKYDYVEYLRTEINIRYLSQKYRKAHEWIPRLAVEAPGRTPEEVLKEMREQLKELRSKRKRLKELRRSELIERARHEPDLRRSLPVRPNPHKEMSFFASKGSPGIELAYPRPLDPRDLYPTTVDAAQERILEQIRTVPPVSNRIDGIARASGFREYFWARPDDPADEWHLFLPYGGSDPDDFTGATGLQFLGEIEGGHCGFAGILQYTLPVAPWDGGVQWCVNQHFTIPTITIDGEGDFKVWSIARQSPTGDDFPDNDSYHEAFGTDQIPAIISGAGEDTSAGPFSVTDTFFSGFPVSKGRRPRIYVGFSIGLSARGGETSLGDLNMAYHFCPGDGLGYTFVRI